MNNKESKFNSQKRAFTLAEILITLGVIGVVAAITMPVLINKINDMVFANQRKKAYSEFARILEEIRINDEFSLQVAKENFKVIQSKFKVVKSCNNSKIEGCWTDTCQVHAQDSDYKKYCFAVNVSEALDGRQGNSVGFVDNSGRQWVHYKNENSLAIIVDVNGDKEPNMLYKDRAPFVLCASRTGTFQWDNRYYLPYYIQDTSVAKIVN